jgi:carboxypeptidase C (cathepsin A)
MFLHYWFVQATGVNPSTAPLVLWMNGGPGCSSLDGYFYEMGPIHFAPSSTLGLVYNNDTWTKIANMLFLESPAGVGFSYSQNSLPTYNDTGVANWNYQFLLNWYQMYPQFKTNPFWITGESYAGIYVPSLANLVQKGVQSKNFPGNFKGVMVGNGVTNADGDNNVNDPVAFLAGHGLISPASWQAILKACPDPNNPSSECNNLCGQAFNSMNNIDIYDIYADCIHQRPSSGSPPCIDSDHARQYLNRADVKTAIHVQAGIKWEICNFNINVQYDRTDDSMIPIYQSLLKNKFRVLIYSGDTDFAVPWTGSAFWTASMKLTPKGKEWRQWNFEDENGQQVAGFVTDYTEGLTYATIKGAGHMVPQFKPIPAFTMFSKFLAGQPF